MYKNSFLIAHRGLHTHYFENSRSAIIAATRFTKCIEVDVLLTKDQQCIIQHDDRMKPLFGLDLNVHKLSFQEIKSIYNQQVGENELLSLSELLKIREEFSFTLNLEIKSIEHPEVNQRLIENVSKLIDSVPRSKIIISSFNHSLLTKFKLKGFDIALLFKDITAISIDKVKEFGAVGVHCKDGLIDRSLVKKIHNLDTYFAIYTVNSRLRMQQLKALGVDAIFTDEVASLIQSE